MKKKTGYSWITIAALVFGGWFLSHLIHAASTSGQNVPSSYSSTLISSLPLAAQNVLTFIPSNATDPISTEVENAMGYTSWIGGNNFPGTISVSPAAHGDSIVSWTLKAGAGGLLWTQGVHTFEFKISYDGMTLSEKNHDAVDLLLEDTAL